MKEFSLEQLELLSQEAPAIWQELKRNQFLPREELIKLQEERFLKMVHHAYENVPLYRKKYDAAGVNMAEIQSIEDIVKLPVLEKEELFEGFPHDTIAKGYDVEDLTVAVTGGSSGKTVRVAYSDQTMRMRVMTAYRIYSMMLGGYKPWHVQTYVYTGTYPLSGMPNGDFPLKHIWTLDSLDKSVKTLLESEPHMLTLYPSRLEDIKRVLTPEDVEKLRKNLKVINVKSEMSTQKQRDEWAEFFGVNVLDEYGSEELAGTVAAQCPHKGYHIWEDINVVEILDQANNRLPDGETGDIVATNLYNWAMPIIRYRQGDIGAMHEVSETCTCGRTMRLLKSFEGRRNSSFLLKSGRFLSSGYLLDVGYTRLMQHTAALNSWTLIQETEDKVVFECIPGPAMNEVVKEQIRHEIEDLLFGEAEVEVRLVDQLQVTPRGKRNQILSKVTNHYIAK